MVIFHHLIKIFYLVVFNVCDIENEKWFFVHLVWLLTLEKKWSRQRFVFYFATDSVCFFTMVSKKSISKGFAR